jgi:hypothetical protein
MNLVICIPAMSFDPDWVLKHFNPFLGYCAGKGIKVSVAKNTQRLNLSIARESVVLTNPGRDLNDWTITAPWKGEVPYDYMLWMDSDMRFTPADFERLLAADKDVATGVYPMVTGETPDGNVEIAIAASDMQGIAFNSMADTLERTLVFGFGFVLVKHGVFERIPRPWFPCQKMNMLGQEIFAGEDTAWCLKAAEAGVECWVDRGVYLPHKKETWLMPPGGA